MTDHGDYITVDVGEIGLAELVEKVRQTGRPVRISCGGEPVAEVAPLAADANGVDVSQRRKLPPVDPKLRVRFLVEPEQWSTEEDWPEHLRVDLPPKKGKR
jgi:antitoxin (DNA-binding transcriptional repressor) of toxin-antitoxin stability system